MMTCKCTCGGCDCPQFSLIFDPAAAAAGAAPLPKVVYYGNTADWPHLIQFVPNAAAAAAVVAMPNVRIDLR